MATDSTNVAVPYSYEPTAKLFTTMIGEQLEVLQTKIGLVFAEDSEKVDFRVCDLYTEDWPETNFEDAKPLIEAAFNYWLNEMEGREVDTFKITCHQICSLKFSYQPIRGDFSISVKRALNEVIQDFCSFVKAAWKGDIPYAFLLNNFLSIKFSFQLCQIDFPASVGSDVTETVNDVYSLKKYQLNHNILLEINLKSFYNKQPAPMFQLPTDDVGSKECIFNSIICHWLKPFMSLLHTNGMEQPTIHTTNLDQTATWAEPDWDFEAENEENFFAELKRHGLSSFCDGTAEHLKVLAQAGVYFKACKSNMGFVVTPLIISRIGLNIPEASKGLEGSSSGGTSLPPIRDWCIQSCITKWGRAPYCMV